MKIIILFLLINFSFPCEDSIVTLTMQDSWGDGWNGNTFCLNSDCTTLLNGSLGTSEFCIDLSIENQITCGGGNWQSEVYWSLSNPMGETIATGGAPFEGCVGGTCEPEIIQSLEFNHNGLMRDYFLYLPNSIEDNAPIVFLLHGYSGSATGILNYSGMIDVANENGFALCVPQGTSDGSGYNFWNVGYDFHQNQNVDDVDFIMSLAVHLQEQHSLNPENTFVTGMSNGGDMSYMLACQTNNFFKAIAPVAGTMLESIFSTCETSPIPVFEIHGSNDEVTLWDGDMQNNDGWGAYLSIPDIIDYWSGNNNCIDYENIFLPNSSLNDGSYIIHRRYFDCLDNSEVWLYEIVDGEHDWPGAYGNMDIQSSQEIWNFFSQYISTSGDINNDDTIDVLDVVQLINIILENNFISTGDLNQDQTNNVQDIIILINIILNL